MSSNQAIESLKTSDKTSETINNSSLNLIELCGKDWSTHSGGSCNTAAEHLPLLSLVADRSASGASHSNESGASRSGHTLSKDGSEALGKPGTSYKSIEPVVPPIGVVPPKGIEPVVPPIGVVPPKETEPAVPPTAWKRIG